MLSSNKFLKSFKLVFLVSKNIDLQIADSIVMSFPDINPNSTSLIEDSYWPILTLPLGHCETLMTYLPRLIQDLISFRNHSEFKTFPEP